MVLLVILAGYLANRGLLKLSNVFFSGSILWVRQLRYWIPILRIVAWLGVCGAVTMILSPTREMLIGLLAALGVAIGFAGQELIKNIFGALVIWIDRAYSEGDRVKIGESEGIVKSIGIRSTKLWAFDDTMIVIPNSVILTANVYNSNSGAPDEQCVIDLYAPLACDSDAAIELARRAALASDLLEPSRPLEVQAMDHWEAGGGPRTLIRVRAYARNVLYEPRFMSDVAIRAKRLFRENGIYDGEGNRNPPREMT